MSPITADHPSSADDRATRSNVKTRLTPNRRRRSVENDEYASSIHRVLRAYARRVAAGDVDALADMTGLATELDEASAKPSASSGRPGTPGRRSRSGSASPARQHNNDGAIGSDALGAQLWGPLGDHTLRTRPDNPHVIEHHATPTRPG
jgi:hypothetical protein